MKRALLLFAFIATAQAQSLTPYYAENFTTGLNAPAWYPANGSITTNANGLTSATYGSLISNVAVPDGTSEYEVRTTYRLTQNGGSYITYLRASADANLHGNTGTFFAIELKDVVVSGNGCTAVLVLWKRESGAAWPLPVHYIGIECESTMVLRTIMRNGHIYVLRGYTWQHPLTWTHDITIAGGRPGVGAYSVPAGNGIQNVALLTADRQRHPNPAFPASLHWTTGSTCNGRARWNRQTGQASTSTT